MPSNLNRRFGLDNHLVPTNSKRPLNTKLIPTKQRISDALIEKSSYHFMKAAWELIESGSFLGNWHMEAITEHLEACFRGQIRRLIINIPPRTGKSLITSVFWPAWVWTVRPETRFIYASHEMGLAIRDTVSMRRIIESDWYKERYPRVRLEKDQNAKGFYQNTEHGMRKATSVGSGITGEGGDIIVVDDPLDSSEASSSPVARASAISWYTGTLSTRLNPGTPIGAKIIVMQRLHENDPSGYLLKRAEEYRKAIAQALADGATYEQLKLDPSTNMDIEDVEYDHLCLPATYSPSHPFKSKTRLHFVDPRTEAGELLWPAGLPQSKINSLTVELGSSQAAGQLQQIPSPEGGGQLKGDWFRRLKKEEWPTQFDEQIQSWDLSYSDDPKADYTVGFCLGRVGANVYLIKRIRKQLDFVDQLKAIELFSIANPEAEAKYVEQAANAKAMFSTVGDAIPGMILLKPTDSKMTRVLAWAPFAEAGNVFVPGWEPWVEEFVHECENFPNGANDDQVDAVGQGIIKLIHGRTFIPEPDAPDEPRETSDWRY